MGLAFIVNSKRIRSDSCQQTHLQDIGFDPYEKLTCPEDTMQSAHETNKESGNRNLYDTGV